MAVQNQPKRYTSDEFDALVKDKQGRYELIDGVIYSLSDPEDADGKIELVDGASDSFDLEEVRRGKLTPVFFGSALTNFGVEVFLTQFLPQNSAW